MTHVHLNAIGRKQACRGSVVGHMILGGRTGSAKPLADLEERALHEIILTAQVVNFLLMGLNDDADRGPRPSVP